MSTSSIRSMSWVIFTLLALSAGPDIVEAVSLPFVATGTVTGGDDPGLLGLTVGSEITATGVLDSSNSTVAPTGHTLYPYLSVSILGGTATFTLADVIGGTIGVTSDSGLNDLISISGDFQNENYIYNGDESGFWTIERLSDFTALAYGEWTSIQTVPLPGTIWLFGSGLLGLAGTARRMKSA